MRQQGKIEGDGDDISHDQHNVGKILDFMGVSGQLSARYTGLDMHDVEPDHMSDRIGQGHDAQYR